MGLCKCPKRKITSHFCFHHCVNVCEYCIINTHTICVVKSYTTWLKEASGNSVSSVTPSALCALCQKQFLSPKKFENIATNFNDSVVESKLAIRLLCYHVIHAECLSTYVKNQFKENKNFKCPSCTWPLWIQQQNILSNPNDGTQPDLNDLSPVALQLYKHLLNNGKWWGKALITNSNINNIKQYLLEDEIDYEGETDYKKSQLLENQSTLEIKPQVNNTLSDLSLSVAPVQTVLNGKNTYNDTHQIITSNVTIMSHRNNILQTHHRHFNNNYEIDSVITHQQQSFVNISQDSDFSNEYSIQSSSPLLLNNGSSLNYNEKQYSNEKYKSKKFSTHTWTSSYRWIIHYFCGTSAEDNTFKRTKFIIICLLISIIILLITMTSYMHSKNIPIDNNSIDYAGVNDNNL